MLTGQRGGAGRLTLPGSDGATVGRSPAPVNREALKSSVPSVDPDATRTSAAKASTCPPQLLRDLLMVASAPSATALIGDEQLGVSGIAVPRDDILVVSSRPRISLASLSTLVAAPSTAPISILNFVIYTPDGHGTDKYLSRRGQYQLSPSGSPSIGRSRVEVGSNQVWTQCFALAVGSSRRLCCEYGFDLTGASHVPANVA